MKEKNRVIADKNIKLSLLSNEQQNPVCSDQAVDCATKEKVRKLCMEKFPNGHALKQADKIEPDKTGNPNKKQGSHSLSQLHHFQNHHK